MLCERWASVGRILVAEAVTVAVADAVAVAVTDAVAVTEPVCFFAPRRSHAGGSTVQPRPASPSPSVGARDRGAPEAYFFVRRGSPRVSPPRAGRNRGPTLKERRPHGRRS